MIDAVRLFEPEHYGINKLRSCFKNYINVFLTPLFFPFYNNTTESTSCCTNTSFKGASLCTKTTIKSALHALGEERGRRRKAEGGEEVGEKEAGEVVRMKEEEAGEDKGETAPVVEVGGFGRGVVAGRKWAGGGRTVEGGRGSEGAEAGRTGDGEGEEGGEEEGGSTTGMW